MRKQGRKSELSQETINQMVEEYQTTDKTAREVGEKYGVRAEVVLYHNRKQQKGIQ